MIVYPPYRADLGFAIRDHVVAAVALNYEAAARDLLTSALATVQGDGLDASVACGAFSTVAIQIAVIAATCEAQDSGGLFDRRAFDEHLKFVTDLTVMQLQVTTGLKMRKAN